MKQILIISGSHQKKGAGAQAIEMFTSQFNADEYSCETVFLSDYIINSCMGCTTCFKKKECIIKDDVSSIIEKMKSADGIIFSTPIYAMNISGLMKTFIDRVSYMLHKPVLYEKHAYIILTTDNGGFKPLSIYMRYILNGFSMHNTGYLGVYAKLIKNSEEYKGQLLKTIETESEKFKRALLSGNRFKPNFPQLVRFNLWKLNALLKKEYYPGDCEYWVENDWIDKEYYYPVKINPFQKVALRIIKRKLRKKLLRTI